MGPLVQTDDSSSRHIRGLAAGEKTALTPGCSLQRCGSSGIIGVVHKITVLFWYPEILGAVL